MLRHSWLQHKMEVSGQPHAPVALRVWDLEPVWSLYRRENSFVPAGNQTPTPRRPACSLVIVTVLTAKDIVFIYPVAATSYCFINLL
jgi:hypothetical protein